MKPLVPPKNEGSAGEETPGLIIIVYECLTLHGTFKMPSLSPGKGIDNSYFSFLLYNI